MSQSGLLSNDTTPLADIEKLTGDTGGAVTPDAAHNINIIGGTSTTNDNDGITVVGTPASNQLAVTLTNRSQGSASSTGAETKDAITFACGTTAGVYQIEAWVVGYDATTPGGVGYTLTNAVRTTGAAAVLCGSTDKVINREAADATSDADIVVDANNFIVRVTGVAAKTMRWNVTVNYIFVS